MTPLSAARVTSVVASVGKDEFVVIWSGATPYNPEREGVVGRRVAESGEQLGEELRISESTGRTTCGPRWRRTRTVITWSLIRPIPATAPPWRLWRPRLCQKDGAVRRATRRGVRGRHQLSQLELSFQRRCRPLRQLHRVVVVDQLLRALVRRPAARDSGSGHGTDATSDGNGILEPGETVSVIPSWTNANSLPQNFWGIARSFTGRPAQPTG